MVLGGKVAQLAKQAVDVLLPHSLVHEAKCGDGLRVTGQQRNTFTHPLEGMAAVGQHLRGGLGMGGQRSSSSRLRSARRSIHAA